MPDGSTTAGAARRIVPDADAPPDLAVDSRLMSPADLAAVSALHARVFGPGRFVRTAYRVREGTPQVSRFCRVASDGEAILAALRMTVVAIGPSAPHLLLGPLAVAPEVQGYGYGKALVVDVVEHAREAGIGIVVLVGDMPYYGRFSFTPVPRGQIVFPGPVDTARILAIETTTGALPTAVGLVRGAA